MAAFGEFLEEARADLPGRADQSMGFSLDCDGWP
jgi:hypothetical protein